MNIIGRVADCYSPLTVNQVKTLKNNGFHAVARYLGNKTHGWSKGATPDEVKNILFQGLKFISVWEGMATHQGYFTEGQAIADVQDSIIDAEWIGQPYGTPIYYTVDYDAQQKDLPYIRLYFQTIEKYLHSQNKYKLGDYGGIFVLNNIQADYHWESVGWQYGQVAPSANMRQIKENTLIESISIDDNEVYSDPGWWPVDVKPKQTVIKRELFNVVVGKHLYTAFVEDNKTYVLWTALNEFTTNYQYYGEGTFTINEVPHTGIVYENNTYIPWDALDKNIKSTKVEWLFTN